MSRTDHFNGPDTPKAQRIVPAVTACVLNNHDEALPERRSDNGRWAMPGGVQEIGESIAEAAVREVEEETGIQVRVTGMVGIYSDPGHVIAFSDGEVRQEFSITLRAQPLGGTLMASSESFEIRWKSRSELDGLDIAPTTRLRLDRGFEYDHAPCIGQPPGRAASRSSTGATIASRAGRTRICRDLLTRITGGSVLTDEAPEFAPPIEEPELYLHFLVTRVRFRQFSMAALVADARAEAARRGARLLRTHCWAGENGRMVREYEELGFTTTLEFEELRSDESFWPGRMLQTRV